jgi:serine protease Do
MDDGSNKTHDNSKSCCRESGIKFVEKKRKKRIGRGVLTVVVVVCSAFAGGIIGGYCVKSSLSTQAASEGQKDVIANTSAELIRQATETSGPAVVGILASSPDEGCSGIIFDSAGYIITSYEAIMNKSSIMVVLPDKPKEPIEAKLIGADLKTGIAVLKIDIQNLTAAVFKNEVQPRVGDMVLSIENPTGEEYSGTLNVGYVSSVNKKMDIDDKAYSMIEASSLDVMRSRGGALCSVDGSVMGLCFVDGEEAKGYALCIDQVKEVADAIMEGSNAKEPYLGIEYKYLDGDIAKAYGKTQGAWISRVRSNSGAEKAGLLKGDIVTMAGSEAINDSNTLARIISGSSPGESISFKVWRDGNLIEITAVIGSSII